MEDFERVSVSVVADVRFTHADDDEERGGESPSALMQGLLDAIEVATIRQEDRIAGKEVTESVTDDLAAILKAAANVTCQPDFSRMMCGHPDDLLESFEDRMSIVEVEGQDAIDMLIGPVVVRTNPQALAQALRVWAAR